MGGPVRTLGEGFPLFFSPDGRTLYLNRELAGEGMGGLWAMEWMNGTMRRAVEGLGGMVAHQLDHGRIVVAENGTCAALRVYDAYLHDVAWSPDGRTIALSRWDGPLGELTTDDVWLADLTDQAALARLPAATATPAPTATPTLPLPPADMAPEDVIRRFWAALEDDDTLTAYAATASDNRARMGLPTFTAHWRCIRRARVVSIEPLDEPSAAQRRYTVWVDEQLEPGCDGWMQPGPFASLIRETPEGPWLIEGFFTGP